MTKGIPLTPREIEEYDRVFRVIDNLDKGSDWDHEDKYVPSGQPMEQMQLFKDAG